MEQFDQIQQYLLNNMSPKDRAAFEEQIAQDQDLAMQVELHRFELETIDQMEEDRLREKAKNWTIELKEENTQSEAKVKQLRPRKSQAWRWPLLAVAASLLLLISFFFWPNPNQTSGALAYGYEQATPTYQLSTRNGAGQKEPAFDQNILNILQERNQTEADRAIEYFKNYKSNDQGENIRSQMNLGHSYLLKGNFARAAELFQQLSQNTVVDKRDLHEITFFHALALYSQPDTKSEGTLSLEKEAVNNPRFAPAAKSILEKFN